VHWLIIVTFYRDERCWPSSIMQIIIYIIIWLITAGRTNRVGITIINSSVGKHEGEYFYRKTLNIIWNIIYDTIKYLDRKWKIMLPFGVPIFTLGNIFHFVGLKICTVVVYYFNFLSTHYHNNIYVTKLYK